MTRSTTPNRMQENWDAVKLFLKQEWPSLTEVDLEEIYRGPDEITQEAAIKGKIKKFLNHQTGESHKLPGC